VYIFVISELPALALNLPAIWQLCMPMTRLFAGMMEPELGRKPMACVTL
jgi:hypothetical protein